MEESKVFKNIWRFNSLIIAAVGILAIGVLLFVGYQIYKDTTKKRNRIDIVNIDPEKEINESFRLGRLQHVKGSEAVIVPLLSDQSFSLKYSGSKSTASTRNILFSNMRTENNHWLLPTNDYLISDYKLINESNSWNHDKDVITIFYYLIKEDTNEDKRLTSNDNLTLALSTPAGKGFTEVLVNIDEILGYDVIDEKSVAVIFNRDNQGYTAYINLTDFSLTKEVMLPKIVN
jgi:hypothetical protein